MNKKKLKSYISVNCRYNCNNFALMICFVFYLLLRRISSGSSFSKLITVVLQLRIDPNFFI